MATCSPVRFIQPAPIDTPASLGVEPGWYVRHACCSIWFEVIGVYGDWVSCVSRDPKRGKVLVSIGSNYSSVNEFCTARPVGLRWIASDRAKSFYDKFFPELDNIQRQTEGAIKTMRIAGQAG